MLRLACVSAAALVLAGPAAAATITKNATTKSYKLALVVGPTETMYTAAEVKAKHPKSGEVMVGSSMDMGGSNMGSANRHLEVHVYSKGSGKVAKGAVPAMTLTDTTGMAMPEKIDAMAMQDIVEGPSDLHYGNNVTLTAGHDYKVVVTVKGEKASFTFRA